ncbi:translation machinery-associated protein 16 homolog isoform X2 [Haemaphysalis longicornis]
MTKANQAEKKRRIQARTSRPVHPNSRRAQQLARKKIHKDKVNTRKKQLSLKLKTKLEKLSWFREKLCDFKADRLAPGELDALIEEYFRRFDHELEHVGNIEQIRGPVMQFKGRRDAIKMTLEKEVGDYHSCGIEMPDLLSPDAFKVFMCSSRMGSWLGNCKSFSANFGDERCRQPGHLSERIEAALGNSQEQKSFRVSLVPVHE